MADTYQIRVRGHLDDRWSDWLGGLAVQRQEDGTTVLVGPVVDQAALHGILNGIRDLSLPIISVQCMSPDRKRSKKMKAIEVEKPTPKKTEALAKGYAAEWPVPAALIVLSAIPIAAGAGRIAELTGGAEITPNNARFFAAPLPVVLHIISATIYCFLGAFQFAPGFRRRKPNWHRAAGRILVPCGLVAALSGLWMTQFYPPVMGDGPILYAIRLLVGSAMVLFICLGFAAIRRRDIPRHRAWMMRGYALGIGAGTQALTHLPWFLFPSIQGELARALCMGAGWAINLAVAEWIIRNVRGRKARPVTAAEDRRLRRLHTY